MMLHKTVKKGGEKKNHISLCLFINKILTYFLPNWISSTRGVREEMDGVPSTKKRRQETTDLSFLQVKNQGQDCLFVDLGKYKIQ